MSTPIKLTVGGQELKGELNDSGIAAARARRLPLKVKMSRWGETIMLTAEASGGPA